MKRFIDFYLEEWKSKEDRKALIIFGARQVGKTYAVRDLGNTYQEFIEINLERSPELAEIFEGDLDPKIMIQKLSKKLNKYIKPDNQTLLFIDEIQAVPRAIIALRYFYEMMPELHVIAAGSLLEFAIQEVGMPVGRVTSLFMYPMSFLEFLAAIGEELAIEEIMNHDIQKPVSEKLHEKFLKLLGTYLAVGGMPEAVKKWALTKDLRECAAIHHDIINIYRRDFNKYSKRHQIKYLEVLFNNIPRQLGKKFKYSNIESDYQKRELSPALNLLETASIIHKIMYSAGQGIPIGAQAKPEDFKIIFLDIALSQAILDLSPDAWLIDPLNQFINKGEITEAFVGQEIIAYQHKPYYWKRDVKGSEAEVDYIIQQNENVIPIEVKSGKGTTLKSMQMFLETHPKSPFGIRFSIQNYSVHEKIYSYPLYAVAKEMMKNKRALQGLM